jgi:hypothetical protein
MHPRRIPLLAAGTAALAVALPSPAHASKTQYAIFEAPQELTGASPELRDQTLDEIKAFGVRRIRILVYWNTVVRQNNSASKPADLTENDPESPGYDWSRYDAVFAAAKQRDIQVIPTITGPVPRWATGRKKGHLFKPDRARFAAFVEAVGKRYGDQVGIWSIWNEPNQPQFLAPQFEDGKPYSPFLYRALYQGALQGLGASGNGGDKVLAGETSPRGNSNIVAPVTFAKLFFRGRKLNVDGWAHHPYTTKDGPFFTPGRTDVTIGVIAKLVKTLDRYAPNRRLGVYLTEFGIQSKPDPIYGVPQQRQAEYRAISEKIAYDNPRVRAFSQYLMRDDQPRSGADRFGGFESGLRLADGTPKLSYDAYRLPLVATQRVDKVKLWGLVRPAGGATTVALQQRDGQAWTDLGQVGTDARGAFTKTVAYKKGREFRVLWGAFSGPPTDIYIAP